MIQLEYINNSYIIRMVIEGVQDNVYKDQRIQSLKIPNSIFKLPLSASLPDRRWEKYTNMQ